MFTNPRRSLSALFILLLLGLAFGPAIPTHADAPLLPKPTLAVTGKFIPDPPHQDDEWIPPVSKVPKDFASAARVLFNQGMADPRGCEYRVIEAATTFDWPPAKESVVRTHGWVFPTRQGDLHSYAVCWNGLVYPLLKAGARADLERDVKAYVQAKTSGKRLENEQDDYKGLWHGDLTDTGTALLLRLGKGALGFELWAANNPFALQDNAPDSSKSDPYLGLADGWASLVFSEALFAHSSRDDHLALCRFRQLERFGRTAESEAEIHGFEPTRGKPRHFDCLTQLPELLADQRRRASAWPREAVVCVGPGRCSDQKKRIAALIARLDEVAGSEWNSVSEESVVDALIREGVPALGPLLECFEQDERLTRRVEGGLDFRGRLTCVSVREVAFVALCEILERPDLLGSAAYQNISTGGAEIRKELADLIREPVKAAQTLPLAERWFALLADDKASPEQWRVAAQRLVASDLPKVRKRFARRARAGSFPPRRDDKAKLVGETLRDRKKPSITELLRQRIKQCDDLYITFDMAMALAQWEPKVALKPLAEQMERAHSQAAWQRYAELLEERTRLGDAQALSEYVALVGRAIPQMVRHWQEQSLFLPMADHPDFPGMAQAAEKLFAADNSPWVPLFHREHREVQVYCVRKLIPTTLLRQPSFRNALLKELANKTTAGTFYFYRVHERSYSIDAFGFIENVDRRDMIPLNEDMMQKFRVCDYCAYLISQEISAAPRCELYWTLPERDKAVTACAEFLRKQQFELQWRNDSIKLDKPATPAQVENGAAVFSLAGEGTVRVVQGLKLPVGARWTTLKDQPYESSSFDPQSRAITTVIKYWQEGQIIQAEEVLKEGKWQRYYGFVGAHHIARVPAQEIDFSLEPDSSERDWIVEWVDIGKSFQTTLSLPPLTAEPFEEFTPRLPANAALPFGVTVRNGSGLDQTSPAPQECLRLRLLYSPEMISPYGELVPNASRETDWKELPPKSDAPFHAENGKMLAPTEEMKLASIDLREWFDVKKQGFYRLQLLPARNGSRLTDIAAAEIRFSLGPP